MLFPTRAHVACVTALAMTASSFAHADLVIATSPAASASPASLPPPPSPPPRTGIAIVARPGAEAAAWALAKDVYARDALRPVGLDEARARVLVGDPAPADAPRTTKDLADERAAIHGDDGASRALLTTIASQLNVRALVVVEASGAGEASARVFLVDSQTFDAARYAPDAATLPSLVVDAGAPTSAAAASDGGMTASSDAGAPSLAPLSPPPPLHWSGMVASLERTFAAPVVTPESVSAPALATSALPPEKAKHEGSHPFYTSPWFWGAVGAAVFGGTAVYFATRDNSTSTIHLDLQVPK